MKRALAAFAIISIFSFSHLSAQVTAPYVSINFYTGGFYDETYVSVPLRNTVNDMIGVFYHRHGNGGEYYFRGIYTIGTAGPQIKLATYSGNPGVVMDAAWNSGSKCYLVVYSINNTAYYGRIVQFYKNTTRPVLLPQRYIAPYSIGTKVKIAQAKNGKFIVFFCDGHKLSAISLNSDASVFKPMKTIINFTQGNLYLGGAEKDGRMTGAYLVFVPDAGTKAWLRMVKMTNQLKKVKFSTVTGMSKPNPYFVFLGKYDPINHIHTAIVGQRYCTFTRKSKIVFALTNLPTTQPARAISYDPVNHRFGLMTVDFYEDPNTFAQGANIYMSTFNYHGTFITPETFLLGPSSQEGNPGSFRVEYAPNGNYLITYCLEQNGGLKGAYFN